METKGFVIHDKGIEGVGSARYVGEGDIGERAEGGRGILNFGLGNAQSPDKG